MNAKPLYPFAVDPLGIVDLDFLHQFVEHPRRELGYAVLGLDLILSIVEQSRIRNAAVSHSENPEFNELMDAFCSPDGLQAVGKVLDEKIKSTPDDESEKGKDQ